MHRHKWTQWVMISVRYGMIEKGSGMVRTFTRDMQERRCEKCGKFQREEMG